MRSTHFRNASFQFAVIVLLAVAPFISAIPNSSQLPQRGVHLRDPVIKKRDLPQGWSSAGCYTDEPKRPTLTSSVLTTDQVAVNFCINSCDGLGYSPRRYYAGLENGDTCYCGNVLTSGSTSAPASDCNLPCIKNHSEICGGTNRLSLYTSWTGVDPPPQPTIVQSAGSWVLMGCYSDSNDARTLAQTAPGNITQRTEAGSSIEGCTGACGDAGFRLAGVEFASECWCGNDIKNGGQNIDTTYCPLACPDNASEICGGANSLILYRNGNPRGGNP